ncbi:hypothetical protein K800_24438 [Salmonella enterica subsp. enterica serovar Newport str. SHSN010]|nr:hypothetical protein K800_24438 [Salmonella enterica subsp. enterica serovar Newport str. SHSN010]
MLLRVLRVMFPGCGLLARALQSCLIRMKTVALNYKQKKKKKKKNL